MTGGFFETAALPLTEVVAVADAAGRPVIVDAAGQLPPVENFWRYTRELGATAAVFSGAKDLAGPYASGVIVGRAEFVDACRVVAFPASGPGRAQKIGKEAAVGLVAAVEAYLHQDHESRRRVARETLDDWAAAVAGVGGRTWVDEEDYFPQLAIALDDPPGGRALHDWMRGQRIATGLVGPDDLVVLCAQCTDAREATVVSAALSAWVSRTSN